MIDRTKHEFQGPLRNMCYPRPPDSIKPLTLSINDLLVAEIVFENFHCEMTLISSCKRPQFDGGEVVPKLQTLDRKQQLGKEICLKWKRCTRRKEEQHLLQQYPLGYHVCSFKTERPAFLVMSACRGTEFISFDGGKAGMANSKWRPSTLDCSRTIQR